MATYGVLRFLGAQIQYLIASITRAPYVDANGRLRASLEASSPTISSNTAQIAGTTTVNAGLAGVQAIGGNVAPGTAPTTNPVPLATDFGGLTRRMLLDAGGGLTGPGEIVVPFSVGTGAASVTDGTNGKTIAVPPVEADVYIGFTAISTTPTIQLEYTNDGVLFSVIPLTRIDNTAASLQYAAGAAFTPVINAVYKGRVYGANALRVHLVAGSASNTTGFIRFAPASASMTPPGTLTSAFCFNAANTTEAAGVANGAVQTGGVRTLAVSNKGAAKGQLIVEAVTGTLSLVVEGIQDGASTWQSLSLQPVGGGALVTTLSFTGTSALPTGGMWEFDASTFKQVRARCSSFTSGVSYGTLRVMNLPNHDGIQNSAKPSYNYAQTGLTPTASTNLLAIESGASKVTRLKRLIIQPGTATAAGIATLTINRETTAGSTNAVTIDNTFNRDTSDANYSGIVRSSGLAAGTNAATKWVIPIPTPINTTANPAAPIIVDFTNGGTQKGFMIPVGTANGLLFVHSGLAGAAGFGIEAEWTEE